MRTMLRGKFTLLFMMLGMLVAIPAVALAAELLVAEVDVGTPATPNGITVEQGGSTALPLRLTAGGAIDCAITATNPAQAKVNKTYSFTKNAVTNAVQLSSTDLSDPVDFYSNGVPQGGGTNPNCGVTWDSTKNTVNANVSVAANVPTGTYTIRLKDDASATASGTTFPSDTFVAAPESPGLTDTTATDITVNVVPPSNQAPSVPGTPGLASGSNTPNQGTFGLTWTASTDDGKPTGSSVTYTLQHKDANDATFSNVATGISGNSYAFGSGSNAAEAEGTWTYQVKASDGTLESAFSAASSAIKVDKSAPSTPVATTNPLSPVFDGWFKDTVTVSYNGSTDPALLDTSAGSGVASYTANQTFSTSGTHNFSGKATDGAGNESASVTGSVKVDATNPTFGPCTGGPFTQGSGTGSQQTVNITATDAHSGMDNAGSSLSGTVNTSTIGDKTVTFTAKDNVGHTVTTTCTYKVIFNFSGFFRPVDNDGVINTVKAGQSIPVKFSLSGDQGLSIFAANSPSSQKVACDAGAPLDALEETATAGSSGLSYDASIDQYNYVWKSDKAWAGTCRKLSVTLIDGTVHTANFKFLK
jgi:hypothetical protein